MTTFRKIRDAVIYGLGVYTACGIAHNIMRRLTRPRYHIVKGGGRNA